MSNVYIDFIKEALPGCRRTKLPDHKKDERGYDGHRDQSGDSAQ